MLSPLDLRARRFKLGFGMAASATMRIRVRGVQGGAQGGGAAVVYLLALTACGLGACADGELGVRADAGVEPEAGVVDGGRPANRDTDGDGLCDDTEAALGTAPGQVDADADGIPDLFEVALDYGTFDAEQPPATSVVRLATTPGATAQLHVRVNLTGSGAGVEGAVTALPSLYDLPVEARAFFDGVVTTGATPQDHVRGVSADSARISAVQGLTQLTFRVSFRLRATSVDLPDCVLAFPVAFSLKSDEAQELARQDLLLLVGPDDALFEPARFCTPEQCL